MTKFLLTAGTPFRFDAVVRSHGWSMLAPFVWDSETGELRRVEQLASGKIVQLSISDAQNGVVVAVDRKLGQRESSELARKVKWMLSFDLDLALFYTAAASEPRLGHVKREAHGRFLRSSTVWEDVVKVMMTTNIQWSGTKRLVRVLVDAFGDTGEPKGKRKTQEPLRAFPKAEVIARSRESRLRKLGLGYRSLYLLQLARGVTAGKFDLDALQEVTRPTDEVRKELLALPGIGPYAAATMLMILGRYEYLGVDTEALSSVSRGFFGGKPIGEKEVQATFARWDKFKAIAYWFWDWEGQEKKAESSATHV